MEDRNQEKRQALRSRISIVSLAVLAVVILACYAAQSRNLIEWEMALGILTGFLVFYWILMDVAEPVLLHEMKDMPCKKEGSVSEICRNRSGGIWSAGLFCI